MTTSQAQALLITGADSSLGKTFANICSKRNIPFVLLSRDELDISDLNSVRKVLDECAPYAVINTDGYAKVDEAESEKEICFRDNVHGPTNLAMICREKNLALLTFSSDLVFDGNQSTPYTEEHLVSPLNTYGLSKVECEEKVMAVYPKTLIIRTSVLFGPCDESNFFAQTLNKIINQEEIVVADDDKFSPTYLPDLVNASLNLLLDGASGVYHLTNKGEVSWAQLAHTIAQRVSVQYNQSPFLIIEKEIEELTLPKRPRNRCLASVRGLELPPLEDAMDRYFTQLGH